MREWKPIETAPPDEDARFIVGAHDSDGRFCAIEAGQMPNGWWIANDGWKLNPTHWLLKLPPPPPQKVAT